MTAPATGQGPPLGIEASRAPTPFLGWLRGYAVAWLGPDLLAGITLAAYAIPVALAYATLAGLPPQAGIYGYMLGGLGYALLGTSRHLAIGPTSAISLMVGSGAAAIAGGNHALHIAVATLAALAVAMICVLAWAARLSVLVKLVSDSVLVGFRFGAGLTIAMTQLPAFFGVAGGGHSFIERSIALVQQIGGFNPVSVALGLGAMLALTIGSRKLPGKPVGLAVVVLAILVVSVFGLAAKGVAVTGTIPPGLPELGLPAIGMHDVENLFPLAAGCVLLAYIEGVSAARVFAERHGYEIDARREFLGLGAANLLAGLGHGYPVAGGLSQTAVNEAAGAKSPLSLVFASLALALCLLFLTGLLANLPRAALAAIVLVAVSGLIDVPALLRLRRISRFDFVAALCALAGVLLLGILQGILLAAFASVLMLLVGGARPHVAVLGRIPGTSLLGDRLRHPENEPIPKVLVMRPEGAIIYLGAEHIEDAILAQADAAPPGSLRHLVCDLSNAPGIDATGAQMLRKLHGALAMRGIRLHLAGAHASVRDVLRADGIDALVGHVARGATLAASLDAIAAEEAAR